jgi:hypothetical protein
MSGKFRSTLTNYAFEIAPDSVDPVAEFLSPEVVTAIYTGYYKDFGDKQAYQAPTGSRRGIGQQAQRLTFDVQDKKFNLDAFALDIPVDDQERKQAAQLDPELLERQKIKYLVRSANNIHAKAVVDLAKTQPYATAFAVDVTVTTQSPTKPIDQAIEDLANSVGKLPNRLLLNVATFNAIRNHQSVITRLQGVSIAGVTIDMIRSMLLNPNIEILISAFVLDTKKPGAASSKANYVGNDIYVFFAETSPSPYDMSFMKTFRMDQRGISAVYQERDWASRSDVFMLDWYEQVLITGSALCRRLQATLPAGF